MADGTGQQIEQALQRSLTVSLQQHAASIASTQERFIQSQQETLQGHATQLAATQRSGQEAAQKQWQEATSSLVRSAAMLEAQQSELIRQGDVLLKVVDATGQVKKLETTLNENLSALAGSRNFEETVMSLAAAIQLLTTKLHAVSPSAARVDLNVRDAKSNAA
jgi:hypothetical protein